MKILLVDDHAIVRVGLKQMLTDAFDQLDVTEVGTGQEALAKAQDTSWDLIILDINLPDTNGLDVLKKLKALCASLPVVVLSFHPEEQYAVRALKGGASAYVTKDTAPQELTTAIKTVLVAVNMSRRRLRNDWNLCRRRQPARRSIPRSRIANCKSCR